MQNRSHHHQHIGAHAGGRRGLSPKAFGDHPGLFQSGDDDGETSERQTNAYPVSKHHRRQL